MLAMTASLSKTGAAVGADGGAAVGAALGATVGAEVGSRVIGGSTTVILAMLAISPYRLRAFGVDLGATNAIMLYVLVCLHLLVSKVSTTAALDTSISTTAGSPTGRFL